MLYIFNFIADIFCRIWLLCALCVCWIGILWRFKPEDCVRAYDCLCLNEDAWFGALPPNYTRTLPWSKNVFKPE